MSNVLSLVKSIQKIADKAPCKKTVQKIVYLIQEANEDLGFDYSIHFYGPYSADLDSEIRYLCSCGDLTMEVQDYGHILSVNDSLDVPFANTAIQNIITRFSANSPSDLELLATTLYVQREISGAANKNILDGVVRIKGAKYSEPQILAAIKELESNNYFSLH
jgi:uncharacterized protein YwgA